MSHTHVSNRIHSIFSTKERRKSIPKEFQPRLWAYMDGIFRKLEVKTMAIGGFDDHCHAFFSLPPTLPLSEVMQKLKANSSRFAADELGTKFGWQEGYSAFSVSISHVDATIRYIQTQEEHHRKKSFDEELAEILRKHGLMEHVVPTGL